MKKTPIILAASLVVLLSACGQKESTAPAAPAAAPAPAAPVTPATPPASEPPAAAPTSEAPAAPATAAPDTAAAPAATAAADGGAEGASVFKKTCSLCHATGVAGAPKVGNKDDWGPRIAKGKDTLYKHAIEGFTGEKGMMPARGGGASLTDDQVKAAVDYMVAQAS